MAQTITIGNATYSDVPSIVCNKVGGGTVSFIDTSDADATAGDILQNKSAYVNGVKIVGTGGLGGSASPTLKYGLSIDNIIGNIDSNGILQTPSAATSVTLTGVQEIDNSKGGNINYLLTERGVNSVSAPDLETIGWESAISTFEGSTVTSISFPELVTVSFNKTFAHCDGLTTVTFPELVTVLGNLASFLKCSNLVSAYFPKLTTIKCQSGSGALTTDDGMFEYCQKLETVSFPELVIVGQENQSSYNASSSTGNGSSAFFKPMHRAFYYCSKLTSVEFPKLTAISSSGACSYMFAYCTKLESVSFPKLEVIEGLQAMAYLFNYSKIITSITFPKLKRIGCSTKQDSQQFYQAFNANTMITEVYFPELTDIYCSGTSTSSGTFASCQKLQKIYLPKLSNIETVLTSSTGNTGIKNLFYGCSALTEIHFGEDNRTYIESHVGYSTKWGATNATIYFDL